MISASQGCAQEGERAAGSRVGAAGVPAAPTRGGTRTGCGSYRYYAEGRGREHSPRCRALRTLVREAPRRLLTAPGSVIAAGARRAEVPSAVSAFAGRVPSQGYCPPTDRLVLQTARATHWDFFFF